MIEGPLRFRLHATSPFTVGLYVDLPNKKCELNMKVLTLISDKFVNYPLSVAVISQARGVPWRLYAGLERLFTLQNQV